MMTPIYRRTQSGHFWLVLVGLLHSYFIVARLSLGAIEAEPSDELPPIATENRSFGNRSSSRSLGMALRLGQ